ncbi:hypothetical protein ACFS27_02475 [Promicromonospora vindobonensis]|uniref:Uncharacterized protein n=1 Tax=Promicromonospora vindobonensis TaxID=195748 RepID=A0ABW5VM72_9MICO
MNLTAFRVGAAAWMFTGVVHDILELVLQADPELDAAMRATFIEIGPISLQADLLNRGVSLSMGLAMFVVGLLLWMIATALEAPSRWMRPFGVVALASSAAALGLAVVFVPGPPLVTFAVATVAFAVALLAKPTTRTRAAAPARPLSHGA